MSVDVRTHEDGDVLPGGLPDPGLTSSKGVTDGVTGRVFDVLESFSGAGLSLGVRFGV